MSWMRIFKNVFSPQRVIALGRPRCPACGSTEFLEGPHGGECINFSCANINCRARFNDMGLFGIEQHGKVGPDSLALFCGPYVPSSNNFKAKTE